VGISKLDSIQILKRLKVPCGKKKKKKFELYFAAVTHTYRRFIYQEDIRVDVSKLDSIQILRHGDWFSTEFRHELILLRYDECSLLDEEMVMCGRYPKLFRCKQVSIRNY